MFLCRCFAGSEESIEGLLCSLRGWSQHRHMSIFPRRSHTTCVPHNPLKIDRMFLVIQIILIEYFPRVSCSKLKISFSGSLITKVFLSSKSHSGMMLLAESGNLERQSPRIWWENQHRRIFFFLYCVPLGRSSMRSCSVQFTVDSVPFVPFWNL